SHTTCLRTRHPLPPYSSFFFFNHTATTHIYTLSLHDALPISFALARRLRPCFRPGNRSGSKHCRYHAELQRTILPLLIQNCAVPSLRSRNLGLLFRSKMTLDHARLCRNLRRRRRDCQEARKDLSCQPTSKVPSPGGRRLGRNLFDWTRVSPQRRAHPRRRRNPAVPLCRRACGQSCGTAWRGLLPPR